MKASREERLRRVIAKLEARRDRRSGFVATNRTLFCEPDETPQQRIERAHREGRPGAFLVLPAPLSDEQWAKSCAKYHTWAMARQARVLDDNFTSATGEEIAEAYRRSLTDEAMPPT